MNRMPWRRRAPDAHVIIAPGRRLLRSIPLRFVRNTTEGKGQRPAVAQLNLVSFIDFLVVTVIFLLMSFSASGESQSRDVNVPGAANIDSMISAPIVVVDGNQILIDGVFVGDSRSVIETGRIQRLDDVYNQLTAKRDLWLSLQPRDPFPGACILAIDNDVPAATVKSVFHTAVLAGYPNVSFLVKRLPGTAP